MCLDVDFFLFNFFWILDSFGAPLPTPVISDWVLVILSSIFSFFFFIRGYNYRLVDFLTIFSLSFSPLFSTLFILCISLEMISFNYL